MFVVIHEDRHNDVAVTLFKHRANAIAHADKVVDQCSLPKDWVVENMELTMAMRSSNWIYLLNYGPEGDSVRVVEKEPKDELRT